MAGVNLLKPGSGSRRRLERIRWKRWELVHAWVLIVLMTAFSACLAIWIAMHHCE